MPLKDIVDPELILFAEHDGKTIGWFPGIQNLNEIFIRLNGLRRPWNYTGLLRGLKRKTRCVAAKGLLVLPEYWNRGVVALLFGEMAKRAFEKGYEWADLSLTAEDNPQTPVLADSLGAVEYKRYRVFYKQVEPYTGRK
jgi:GNAT superfamily N-acetyltransferase